MTTTGSPARASRRSVARPRVGALFAAVVFVVAGCGDSYDPTAKPVSAGSQGRELVLRLFNDVKDRNEADLRGFLAPNFQLQRTTGPAIGKDAYISGLPDLRAFRIGPVAASEYEGTLTAAYTASTDLVVEGVKYPGKPAPYISSFVKLGGEWRLVAHGNFNQPQ